MIIKSRINFVLLILCVNSLNLIGQNEYYDARRLQNSLSGNRFSPEGAKILFKYFSIAPNIDNVNDSLVAINQAIKSNPFYKNYNVSTSSPHSVLGVDASQVLNTVGSLDVTNIADGFAKFIVERTKKELQASFFDRFIEEIKKEDYKDIQTLFPATYLVIKRIPDDVYNYEKFLQSLRNAFGTDFGSLLPNLESVLRHGKFEIFFDSHLELKSICLTALYYGKGLQKGTHIGELIENYKPEHTDYKLTWGISDTIKTNAIRFIQELSKSFRTVMPGNKEYWVSSDSIMMLVDDKEAFNIYLGLLYQKVNRLKVDDHGIQTYGMVMANINDDVSKIKSLITNFSEHVNNLQNQLQSFQSKAKKDRTINDYIDYFASAVSVLNSFKENEFVSYLISETDTTIKIELNRYWNMYSQIIEGTNEVLSLYNAISEKNYSIAINNVRNLYQMRFDPEIINKSAEKNKVQGIIDFLMDKGAFIASVAEAKNSDEVYKAIDAIAMPVGSARVKRLSNFNIAVNAYCGLFTGYERIKGFDKGNFEFNSFGLAAPIGFTISKGKRFLPWPISELTWFNKSKTGWSSSMFISIVDLGAIAAYRFTNDSTDQVPTIQLRDIFSPGIFWSLGLPKCPLSINFGLQLGPNLRKVHSLTNDFSSNTYIRYSVSVCVDLPLLNLYTKSK